MAHEPEPGVADVQPAEVGGPAHSRGRGHRAQAGDDVVYVTNNSMHYRGDYVTRLAGMGAPVSADMVVSSSRATAAYLREHDPEIRRVLAIGLAGALFALPAQSSTTTQLDPGARGKVQQSATMVAEAEEKKKKGKKKGEKKKKGGEKKKSEGKKSG